MESESNKKSAESQINVVIGTLLESAADKNESVCFAVNNALKKIAKKHPNELLKTTCLYRQRNSKLTNEHVAALLQPMEDICQEQIIEIDGDTVLLLINFCVEEITRNVEYVPSVQMPASAVLVAIGKKHCIQVMEGLLKKFIVGTVPHYTIPHTMGALASSNPFAVLPFLKSILGTMLPMLGMLRTDPLKQSFAFALGRFCEAINEYMSNIKHAPDPTIQKDMFSTEIGIAYDVLSANWLQSREPKLVETVLQALGSMFSILTPEKVIEQTPKMIVTLLFMCKKQKDCYSITQCLASVLIVVVNQNKILLEPHIDALLNTLSETVYPLPDYVRPETVKNQAEVLRCYDQIGTYFCDKTVDNLILMLKNNNEKDRIKALIVVTHLVNSSDSVIKSRVPDLITILKHMLAEQNIRVKIVLLKTIVAFAYHGNFFNGECNIFIEFIIKLCCSTNTVNSKGVQELSDTDWSEMLRTCDNSLYLLTSSVLELENVFWNLFHECILNKDYINAYCTLLRCLTNLATRKKEHSKMADEETQISSLSVFVRCLSLLASPLPNHRGTYILNFFKTYSYYVHKHLRALWDVQIPQLLKYLENSSETWNPEDWETKILQFLTVTIKEIDESKWTETLALTFIEQLPLYYISSEEKGFSLKCLATVMCHVEDSKFVKQHFEVLMNTARYSNPEDAMACAKAVGICARTHMHPVILKLNTIRREELLKKANKFLNFNFMKDAKHENEIDKLRYTIIACYSELVLEAPAEKLLLTIEHEVLDWVVTELQNTKDFLIKNICIYTIGKVADAMHPNRNTLHIRMQSRDEVLNLVLSQLQLHNGPEYIELYPVILPVLTSLVKLRNDLEAEQRVHLIKTCFDTIYNAAAIYCKLNTTNKDVSYGDLKLAPNVFNSFDKLNTLTRTLLLQSMNPATLDDILTMLEPWLNKKKPEQRLPTIENLQNVLDCYLNNMKFAYETPSKFGQTGFILGRIIPRCTDPNNSIRLVALECVRLVLCIAARYEGHMSDYNNEIGNQLSSLKADIISSNPKVLYSVTSDIAKIIAEYLPQFQQMHFVESLLDGLLDHEPSSSSGGSVTLTMFLRLKGGELYQHVNDIIIKLLNLMNFMTCNKTRTSSVRSVLAMAIHHPKSVVSVLLTNPLPYDSGVSDCWMTLAQEPTLAADILEQFKRLFNTIPLYEEQQNAEKLRICTLQPLAAVCALREMFRNNQMVELVSQQFPELFVIMCMVFASYIGTSPPIHSPNQQQVTKKDRYSIIPNRDAYKLVPARIALDTVKLLLLCAGQERVAEVFLQAPALDSCSDLLPLVDTVPHLAQSVFTHAPSAVARLVAALNEYKKSGVEAQRVMVNAFFVEVMKHRGVGQPALVEAVLGTLLSAQSDAAPLVRLLALRGLGHVARLQDDQAARHAAFVFAALMQGVDDPEVSPTANIPLESMLAFSAMLSGLEQRSLDVSTLQVSAAVRIKPFLTSQDAALRRAATRLFGDLARSHRRGARDDAFREQLDGNVVTLLLHLSDEDSGVVKACKYTLRQIAPLMDAKNVNIMVQDHLIDEGNLHYTNFISDLIKIMTDEIRDRFPFFILNALSFLKSPWSEIRGNAALLIGLLFTQLQLAPTPTAGSEADTVVQLDTVCYRLMQLLHDEQPDVRAKAAQGLSCLFAAP